MAVDGNIYARYYMCLWFLKSGAPYMELEMDGMQGCANKFVTLHCVWQMSSSFYETLLMGIP